MIDQDASLQNESASHSSVRATMARDYSEWLSFVDSCRFKYIYAITVGNIFMIRTHQISPRGSLHFEDAAVGATSTGSSYTQNYGATSVRILNGANCWYSGNRNELAKRCIISIDI